MHGKSVLVAASLLAAWGCRDEAERPEPLPFDQVPAEVKAAAAKTLPNVKFDKAQKVKVNGQEVYEVRGKERGGKIREVEVSTSGKVLKTE
jgi:hypothetical protein